MYFLVIIREKNYIFLFIFWVNVIIIVKKYKFVWMFFLWFCFDFMILLFIEYFDVRKMVVNFVIYIIEIKSLEVLFVVVM